MKNKKKENIYEKTFLKREKHSLKWVCKNSERMKIDMKTRKEENYEKNKKWKYIWKNLERTKDTWKVEKSKLSKRKWKNKNTYKKRLKEWKYI